MTSKTRRRLLFSLMLGLIALPAEALLLPVARTPDPAAAAEAWTADLTSVELRNAAFVIEDYPAAYRRAIMTTLAPEERSETWRNLIAKYSEAHPELTPEQASLLDEAIAVASPDAFRPPLSAELAARITDVFNRSLKVLGPQATNELFVTLGPANVGKRNRLPATQQIADRLRSWRVASAGAADCNCNIDIDTCDFLDPDPWLVCSEQYTCRFDLTWPMCGPLWSWACTGWCKIVKIDGN